jgi:hypothetical protein
MLQYKVSWYQHRINEQHEGDRISVLATGCFKDPKLSNSFSLKSIIQIGDSKINWLQNNRSHFIHLQLTEWTWKETVVACLEVLSEHLLAKTKENSKNTKPR